MKSEAPRDPSPCEYVSQVQQVIVYVESNMAVAIDNETTKPSIDGKEIVGSKKEKESGKYAEHQRWNPKLSRSGARPYPVVENRG